MIKGKLTQTQEGRSCTDEGHGPAVLILHIQWVLPVRELPWGSVCSAIQPHEIHNNNTELVLTLCVAVPWNPPALGLFMLIIWKKISFLFTVAEGNSKERFCIYVKAQPAAVWRWKCDIKKGDRAIYSRTWKLQLGVRPYFTRYGVKQGLWHVLAFWVVLYRTVSRTWAACSAHYLHKMYYLLGKDDSDDWC